MLCCYCVISLYYFSLWSNLTNMTSCWNCMFILFMQVVTYLSYGQGVWFNNHTISPDWRMGIMSLTHCIYKYLITEQWHCINDCGAVSLPKLNVSLLQVTVARTRFVLSRLIFNNLPISQRFRIGDKPIVDFILLSIVSINIRCLLWMS